MTTDKKGGGATVKKTQAKSKAGSPTKRNGVAVHRSELRVHASEQVTVSREEYQRLKSLEREVERRTQPASFWTPKTFDELAREQGITPLQDWKEIAGGWPKDEDFEAFLADVRAARAE